MNAFSENLGDNAIFGVAPDAALMADDVIIPIQTHSCNVKIVGASPDISELEDTDALITLRPGVRIGVRTADCVPVVIYAPDINAVAAVHAGWKGSLGGIVGNTLGHLVRLGARPENMHAAFGPSICGQCYEVSQDLADSFVAAGFAGAVIGQRHVSLELVNTMRLQRAGVPLAAIRAALCCTLETPSYPSWRRNPTSRRLLTWIQLLG